MVLDGPDTETEQEQIRRKKVIKFLDQMDKIGGHQYMPVGTVPFPVEDIVEILNAGVAQSAEQGFRTAKAAGSTPVSSSTESEPIAEYLTEDQRMVVIAIASSKTNMDDMLGAAKKVDDEINAAEEAFEDVKRRKTTSKENYLAQALYYKKRMETEEIKLRKMIWNEGQIELPLPKPPEPTSQEESEEIGRAS